MSAFEIKELTQRMNGAESATVHNPSDVVIEEDDPEQILQRADRVMGVGFDKQHILSMSAKAMADGNGGSAMNQISAANVQDLKYLDQQKKLTMISFLTEKIKAEKETRKQDKAARKEERKQKKQQKKKHPKKRSSSPSSSDSEPHRRESRSRRRSRSRSSEDRKDSHRDRDDDRKRHHRR